MNLYKVRLNVDPILVCPIWQPASPSQNSKQRQRPSLSLVLSLTYIAIALGYGERVNIHSGRGRIKLHLLNEAYACTTKCKITNYASEHALKVYIKLTNFALDN